MLDYWPMTRNTAALFSRTSRSSGQVILPINDSALSSDGRSASFLCVHSVSGVAGTDFLDLARRFDPMVRFYGIQAPLTQMRKLEFGDSIESIAEYYADSVSSFQPEGTIHLGGYCVGAIVALEMAKILRAKGREVGPLFVIDGAPENTGGELSHWRLRYWIELFGNFPGWLAHADLMRNRSLRSFLSSLSNNAVAIVRGSVGLRRGQKFRGGYAMDGLMDLSIYPPEQRLFINRLFSALFRYVPKPYAGDIVVYEAKIAPLLYAPQIGRTWSKFAPQSQIVRIVGTHIGMMHEPYVGVLASDICDRIEASARKARPA